MHVAIYARVSTADQHCRQQLEELHSYCQARKWKVAGEYVDRGVSGGRNSRPALDQLLEAARIRNIDVILVWKLDRWGRSVPHLVDSLQELHHLGVRFIVVTQGIDTDGDSPMARLMLHLLAAFAEFERALIVERTRAGLKRARREGRIGGRPRLIVDKDKIRRMNAEGKSMRAIGTELGISAAAVCRLLKAR